jgi:diacylglycerol O-acyltransferase
MNATRMSPLDAAFLQAEDAEPEASLAIASIAVFEGPAPSREEFRSLLADRLPLIPRYRQKVREVWFDLGAPVWVDDPHFNLDHHLVHTALPAPGGATELRALTGRVMSARLDRDRPLWQYWLVEGLAGDRWALISKVHHCMVDGISGTDLYNVVLDPTPTPRPNATDNWQPADEPSDTHLALAAAADLALLPITQARALAGAVRHPAGRPTRLASASRGAVALLRSLWPADRSSLTGPVARPRNYTWASADTAAIRGIRRDLGGTFNDVVLSAVTGGFRALLLARGEQPTPTLIRTLVPVSVRAPGDGSIRDNRVSLLLAHLPVHLDDPVECLAAIRTELETLKASGEAEAGELLTTAARYQPFPLVALPVRALARLSQRAVVTVTTNVPGPRQPLYALGRELVDIIPYVPIASTLRIGVSIFSYQDRVTFGITGDESATDLDVLAAGIEQHVGALERTVPRRDTP